MHCTCGINNIIEDTKKENKQQKTAFKQKKKEKRLSKHSHFKLTDNIKKMICDQTFSFLYLSFY